MSGGISINDGEGWLKVKANRSTGGVYRVKVKLKLYPSLSTSLIYRAFVGGLPAGMV